MGITVVIVFMVVFLTFALLRVPIGYSILIGGIAGFLLIGLPIDGLHVAMFAGLDSFSLLAIPAFILAGNLMVQGGVSRAIIDFVNAIMCRVRGSLGAVAVVVSMLFGSITGSSVATVTAVGGIMAPEMIKQGYEKSYTCALIAAAGFLGILIPPSVPGIMYALMVEEKVTMVWMSTLMPGLVLGVLYIIINYFIYGRKQDKATLQPFSFKKVGDATPKALVAFLMPIIIFGGVYGGIFTATEAGTVAVFYGIIAGWLIYPYLFKMNMENSLIDTVSKSVRDSAAIVLLVATAAVISRLIVRAHVTEALTDWLMGISDNKIIFLLVVNLILIIVGMFMETVSAVCLFAPLLTPIAVAYGVDPIHFGAILLLNLEIGMITPPFAVNIFAGCKLTKTSINQVIKPMLPFYVACLIVLLITTYIPEFSLFFAHLFG